METLITVLIPPIGPEVRQRIQVQPVETLTALVPGRAASNGVACGLGEPELINVVACQPVPKHLAIPRHL